MSTAWLLTVALTSCKQIENDLESNPASNQQNIETQEATKKGLPRKDSVLSGNHSLIRTDEENIVSVAIENDKASIHFEREKWNEVRGLSYGEDIYFIPETMPDAFYPIQVEEGNIVDACIAKIPSLETNISDEDYIIPVVVLLKDNDSIEWFYANPNAVLFRMVTKSQTISSQPSVNCHTEITLNHFLMNLAVKVLEKRQFISQMI